MSKRYEFYGTHYNKNNAIMASDEAHDNEVVMYVNQQKIYEGPIDDIYFGINDWLKSEATVFNKYSLVDWCNSLGDPIFEESEELPADAEIADVIAKELNYEYNETVDTLAGFYVDGSEYINMEVFSKADEVEQ